MSHYRVDTTEISASSAAVSQSVNSIRQAVNSMFTNLNNLQSVWHGSAAQQFGIVADQWRASQHRMEESLEGIQNALSQASSVYTEAENRAQALFSY